MEHQIKGVEFLVKNGGIGALFWDVGTGKTIGSLATYLYFKEKEPDLKLFIICLLSLIEGAWINEIEKFAPHLYWHDLHAVTSNNPNIKNIHGCDIWIVNFEYIISKTKFDEMKVQLSRHRWMCVVDESSKMKNHAAKTTECILELANLFQHRVVMSGTPAPNIEWEYWPQMKFLNPAILGDNFHRFKNLCFKLKRGKQVMEGKYMNKNALREMFKQGFKYEIDPKRRVEMMERMKPWVNIVKARDCMDLPEEIDEYRIVEMDSSQRAAYNEMKEHLVLELKESESFAVANIILTKFMKLRQITSNFCINENGQAIQIGRKNPKMQALEEIIEECGNEQIIIWGHFHFEIESIVKLLEGHGGVSVLYGKTPQSERIDHINRFIDGTNRFLVVHPASGGHGLTFINCHIQIFYSLDYSNELWLQCKGRTMRYGQKNNCVYFYLLVKNSIDEDILAILQRKATTQDVAEKYMKG